MTCGQTEIETQRRPELDPFIKAEKIQIVPGGLYVSVDGATPVCMYTDGPDVVILKLSRDMRDDLVKCLKEL